MLAKPEPQENHHDAELFLDSVVENIPNMIFVKDAKELRFVRFNKAGEELLGFERKDLIGKNDYDFFPKDQAEFFISRDRAVLNHKTLVDIPEEPIDTKLKGKRTLHTKKIPILDDKGEPAYLLGISEDITDSKKMQEDLKAIEELREIDKMKSEFITIAAHQLRTPLSGLSWTLEAFVKGEYGALADEQKLFISKALQSTKRMIALVNDLLEADRLNAGKYKFEFAPVNVLDLLDGLLAEISTVAMSKGVTLAFDRPQTAFPFILADALRVRAVMQNLIENAIKYSPKSGEVKITIEKNDKEITVSVSDNGIGIPEEEKDKIFNRFFRGSNAIKIETDGSGLGLYIAKIVVERHNGKIWFDSEVGKGTAFHFTLPLSVK